MRRGVGPDWIIYHGRKQFYWASKGTYAAKTVAAEIVMNITATGNGLESLV